MNSILHAFETIDVISGTNYFFSLKSLAFFTTSSTAAADADTAAEEGPTGLVALLFF